jgi:DNA-directed RNA polymerase subunit K/omega
MNHTVDPNIQSIDLMEMAAKVGNVYKAVAAIGIRSNQVASQMRQELYGKLQQFGTLSENTDEVVENKEQIEIARQYESMPKPTLIALNEFLKDKIQVREQSELS